MAGPCCCSSNVQAAKVLGIIFVVLSLLSCLTEQGGSYTYSIIGGIAGALIWGILVYGAVKRSSTAILVWMVLAILLCIYYAVFAGLAIITIVAGAASGSGVLVALGVIGNRVFSF